MQLAHMQQTSVSVLLHPPMARDCRWRGWWCMHLQSLCCLCALYLMAAEHQLYQLKQMVHVHFASGPAECRYACACQCETHQREFAAGTNITIRRQTSVATQVVHPWAGAWRAAESHLRLYLRCFLWWRWWCWQRALRCHIIAAVLLIVSCFVSFFSHPCAHHSSFHEVRRCGFLRASPGSHFRPYPESYLSFFLVEAGINNRLPNV